nr:unnamed protein product [Callosobruchus chinensis]
MASRPFSQVLVEVEPKTVIAGEVKCLDLKRKKRDSPSPIALEPCFGNRLVVESLYGLSTLRSINIDLVKFERTLSIRAAVLSLLIRLPTGGEPYTARGQSQAWP